MSRLTEAFRELCAVTRPRPDQSEGGIEATASRLFKVLGEYAEPIALEALDAWPRRSEWFPTEKELRDLLEEVTSAASHKAASEGAPDRGRYLYPIGKTALLVERAKRLYSEDYCKSWLAGGITCLFSDTRIFTTGAGVERLTHDLKAVMDQLGVEVVRSETATKQLRDYCDRRQLTHEPKRGRRA